MGTISGEEFVVKQNAWLADNKKAIQAVAAQMPRFVCCPVTHGIYRLSYEGGDRIALIFEDQGRQFVFTFTMEHCRILGDGLIGMARGF